MKINPQLLNSARKMPELTHNHTHEDVFDIGKSEVFSWIRKCEPLQQYLFNLLVKEKIIIYNPRKHWEGNPKLPRVRSKRIKDYAFLTMFPRKPSTGISYSDAVRQLTKTSESSISDSTARKRIKQLRLDGLLERLDSGLYVRVDNEEVEL